MNNETVFFNPGDAIANSRDFREARRSAEIFKAERPTERKIVIAEADGKELFAVYYADTQKTAEAGGTAHHIKDEL